MNIKQSFKFRKIGAKSSYGSQARARARARTRTRIRAFAAGAHRAAQVRYVVWSTEPKAIRVIVITGHVLNALRWSVARWRQTIATATIAARAAWEGTGAFARARDTMRQVHLWLVRMFLGRE